MIKQELAESLTPDPNREQWLRGRYAEIINLLSIDFEEVKETDES